MIRIEFISSPNNPNDRKLKFTIWGTKTKPIHHPIANDWFAKHIFPEIINRHKDKELTDDDIRKRLYQSQEKMIEEDMAPFGFIDDGIVYAEDAPFVDADGDYWTPTKTF